MNQRHASRPLPSSLGTMADKSSIEWTDAAWNPVTGCTNTTGGVAARADGSRGFTSARINDHCAQPTRSRGARTRSTC
jgi:protein gp37